MIFVGHVTKEGAIAGPRVLEHIVDTVLYFEGDTHSSFRLVRAIKNRYGAANELGVFAMTERGLKGVSNPSALFLSQHAEPVAGSAIVPSLVTWPTNSTTMPRCFASLVSCAAHSRTCETLPGALVSDSV